MKSKIVHLPGLNGLRAIGSVGVLFTHLFEYFGMFNLKLLLGTAPNGRPVGLQIGKYGVTIFFALSGFLITYLLLLEKERQPIQIRKFYLRRILRIWPLYYFYLGLVFATYFIFKMGHHPDVLPYYIFYTANIPFLLRTPLFLVEHYWSLGVEEQFYLFWPWIIRKTRINLLTIVGTLLSAILLIKLIMHFVFHIAMSQIIIEGFAFHCMMIGGMGAILYKKQSPLFLKLMDNKLTQLVAWMVLISVFFNRFHIASIIDAEIIACITVAIITGQVNRKNRLVNLEIKPFDFLGKISYGIYVYHPLIIFLTAKIIGPLAMPDFAKYSLVFFCVPATTILIAYLSYTYFESYFQRLKERFTVVRSANSQDIKSTIHLKNINC